MVGGHRQGVKQKNVAARSVCGGSVTTIATIRQSKADVNTLRTGTYVLRTEPNTRSSAIIEGASDCEGISAESESLILRRQFLQLCERKDRSVDTHVFRTDITVPAFSDSALHAIFEGEDNILLFEPELL